MKAGDVVAVDVGGRRAFGEVLERVPGGLRIRPITQGFTWRSVKARQVTVHYARRR